MNKNKSRLALFTLNKIEFKAKAKKKNPKEYKSYHMLGTELKNKKNISILNIKALNKSVSNIKSNN